MITLLDISIYLCCGFGIAGTFYYLGASPRLFGRFFDMSLS